MAVNGLWVSSSGVSLHADADDVAWSDVGILSATTFVLCVAGETDADHGTIEILHWQGSEKPLTFKVKLSDPNPPTLLDGDGVIDEATELGRAHSELQSLMRISYAVFCLKKKKNI